MSINKPTREWTEVFRGLDIPKYDLTFAALLSALGALLLTPEQCNEYLAPFIKDMVKTSYAEFLINHHLPEILEATANINLSFWLKITLIR